MDIIKRHLRVHAVDMVIATPGEVGIFNLDSSKFDIEVSLFVVFEMGIKDLHITSVLK